MTRIEKETIIRALEQHAKSQSDIEQNARERGEPDLLRKRCGTRPTSPVRSLLLSGSNTGRRKRIGHDGRLG